MEKESQEIILFEKSLRRVNWVLGVLGLTLDGNDMNRSLVERLRKRIFYCFNWLWFNNDVILEVAWLIDSLLIGRSIIEITYFIPCLTLCILGDLKAFYFVLHAKEVNDIVKTLKRLQSISKEKRAFRVEVEEEIVKKQMPMLNFATYSLWCTNMFGLSTFAIGPLVITAIKYKQTGVFQLELPFLLWYPFNPSDVRIWPFTYVHQLWSAVNAVLTVVGPDNYFSTCCTFIHIQFLKLRYDIERINIQKVNFNVTANESIRTELVEIIERHRELIRCVEMLETIFTKSTLFNVATSSLLICITGFNVTTIDNYILMTPFIAFLLTGMFQIYLFCYYGDLIRQSSTEVGDAVYNSLWYTGNAAVMRDMLLISMRSRRPCKLSAFGFVEVNLNTFCRIMSTAWSYFALLKTVYK